MSSKKESCDGTVQLEVDPEGNEDSRERFYTFLRQKTPGEGLLLLDQKSDRHCNSFHIFPMY